MYGQEAGESFLDTIKQKEHGEGFQVDFLMQFRKGSKAGKKRNGRKERDEEEQISGYTERHISKITDISCFS
jgi:hypothetical protein